MTLNKMKTLILALIVLFNTGCVIQDFDSAKSDRELAYFNGQVDALNGDIRIKINADSCYTWRKSPWDNGYTSVYKPGIDFCK